MAVESAIRIGLALNCEIAEWCRFARKNYFYPDMPKNFQTSQYDEPIAFDGWTDVEVDGDDVPHRDRARPHGGGHRQVAARRRRDRPHPRRRLLAGRLQPGRHPADRDRHPADRGHRRRRRRSSPGRTSPQLRDLLLGLGVSDVRMDQGSLRCDVNLSLRAVRARACSAPAPRPRTSTRSARSSGRSATRSSGTPASSTAGGTILQETRHLHEDTGVTTPRPGEVRRRGLPLLPRARPGAGRPDRGSGSRSCAPRCPSRRVKRRARLQADWGFSDLEMRDTVGAGALDLVEETVAAGASPQAARKWWLSELARRANEHGVDLADLPVTPGAGGRGPGARRRRHAQRQARPAGLRRRARR